MFNGLLVALEGIDGSGTTSQLEQVATALRARGHVVHTTAEPSNGPIGQELRAILGGAIQTTAHTVALLFAADRLDHLHREILPALADGKIVLTDRYLHSSIAYQSLAANKEWLVTINREARLPDLAILLQVPTSVAEARRAVRGGPEELFDANEKQRKIAAAYDLAFQSNELGETCIVDGTQSIPAVTAAIVGAISTLVNS